MLDKELLTVREYAEILGITQQAVYKRLNKTLAAFVVEVDGKKFIKREALNKLDAKPEPQQQNNDITKLINTLNHTIDILQEQLSIKDNQIKDLNNRLEQALNNTTQSHYIAAQAQIKTLDSEDSIEELNSSETLSEVKRGFFKRLFSKD